MRARRDSTTVRRYDMDIIALLQTHGPLTTSEIAAYIRRPKPQAEARIFRLERCGLVRIERVSMDVITWGLVRCSLIR